MSEPRAAQQAADQMFDEAATEREQFIARRVSAPSGPTRQRTVQIALSVAVPVLIAVLTLTFAGPFFTSWLETVPPGPAAAQEAQKELDTLVADIEAFRKDYNALPATLVAVGIPSRGRWSYALVGTSGYRVRGTMYGHAVSFDSPHRQEP